MKSPIAVRAYAAPNPRPLSPLQAAYYFWLFLPQKSARSFLSHVESVGKMLRHPKVGYTRLYSRLTRPFSKKPPK
jgi:hypothetical protein